MIINIVISQNGRRRHFHIDRYPERIKLRKSGNLFMIHAEVISFCVIFLNESKFEMTHIHSLIVILNGSFIIMIWSLYACELSQGVCGHSN